jgi:endonuclease/exonuclease/phosphatase (EEP) superfamily protein YafD
MQLAKLLRSDVIRRTHRHTPLLVGGDYNDVWGTIGKRIMQPAGFAAAGKRIRTFPAALPMRALDHIFYRGDVKMHHVFAPRTQLARQASDHLPLVADFELLK